MATAILFAPPEGIAMPGEARAAAILAGGGIAAFPTDTFYGLGGSALSARAVDGVYTLKGRPRGKPLPIVVADREMAETVAAPRLPEAFGRLAEELWPGPLSLIVRAGPVLPPAMLGPGGTVAMREPALPWLRSLLRRCGPLISTSANLSGESETDDPAEVRRLFDGRVDLIIDGGRTPGGAASTMVDLTGVEPALLRAGAVPWDRVLAVLAAGTHRRG